MKDGGGTGKSVVDGDNGLCKAGEESQSGTFGELGVNEWGSHVVFEAQE